ncbi:hypothetical protein HDU78_006990 [Chytriomyces hyalinus]|nr:hypothetical protein HDU78_006990 [Chytriomyces hyalinus]
MAEPAPAAAAAPAAPAAQDAGIWGIAQTVGRFALMYYGMQWLKGNFNGADKGPTTKVSSTARVSEDGVPIPQANIPKPPHYLPLWRDTGALLDLHVYFSQEDEFDSFGDVSKLIWKQSNIAFGDTKDMRYEEMTLDLNPDVQKNGSLYAHMYLTYSGHSPNPVAKSYVEDKTLYTKKLLTRYQKRRKVIVKKNLVSKKGDVEEEAPIIESPLVEEDDRWISYWWSNLTISMVGETMQIPSSVPPAIQEYIELAEDGVHYYPIFYADEFWMLGDQLQPINETVKTVNLTMKWEPKSFWYFQSVTMMEDSFKTQVNMLGQDSRETDAMKRMFSDTNPILLAVTMVVSMLHSLFDFLAFKNDISFWKNKKDMEGMSFRTIVLNVITQLIIFLYLLDNETSWMIIISNGVGLVIEAWKINKTVIVQRKDTFPFFDLIDKYPPSKLTKKTRKYDEMAFKYLSYALVPLLIGYTIYSVMYEEHKGWYSFIIGTLVGFVYMFGFISMTPQLFINYKLKSVAHMPWKTFMYKALNTFIDDLFAFVIKMPWLHRIACLRDDLVFFIYLYQRYIYPEDKRRRNEFGQVGDADAGDDSDFLDSDDEDEKTKEGDKSGDSKSEKEVEKDGVRSRKGFKADGVEKDVKAAEGEDDDVVAEKSKPAKKEGKKSK